MIRCSTRRRAIFIITVRSHLNEIWRLCFKKNKSTHRISLWNQRLCFKLEEEEGVWCVRLLRWPWPRRRRRRSLEINQTLMKLNKFYVVLFVFSQGLQRYKRFFSNHHIKSKTKQKHFKIKNANTRFRTKREKLAH